MALLNSSEWLNVYIVYRSILQTDWTIRNLFGGYPMASKDRELESGCWCHRIGQGNSGSICSGLLRNSDLCSVRVELWGFYFVTKIPVISLVKGLEFPRLSGFGLVWGCSPIYDHGSRVVLTKHILDKEHMLEVPCFNSNNMILTTDSNWSREMSQELFSYQTSRTSQ